MFLIVELLLLLVAILITVLIVAVFLGEMAVLRV